MAAVIAGVFNVRAECLHRWSFNGNLNDSVGGSTATVVGNVTTNDRRL